MESLERIWRDIRQGENIDLYLTVVVSIVLTILTIIDVVPSSWVMPLNLSILALFSFAILGNRYRIETVLEKLTNRSERLLTAFPGDQLRSEILSSKELMLLGADLNLTLMRNYPQLTDKLQKGDSIKVLLVNPESPACEMTSVLHYEPMPPDDKRRVIHRSLSICRELKHRTDGELEVRLLDHLPTFGAFALDLKSPDGVLYLWHYTFKTRDAMRPKMILRPTDGYWYQFFCEEISTIWDNATIWQASDLDQDNDS